MKKTTCLTLVASLMSPILSWTAFAAQPSTAAAAEVVDWGQGVKVRLARGSVATVEQATGKVAASNLKGRFYVKIDGHTQVSLKTTSGTIVADSGEFLFDAQDHGKLHVFKGNAHVEGPATDVDVPLDVQAWAPSGAKEIALRGSDVRRREVSPDEFARRKQRTKGVDKTKVKPPVKPVTPPTTTVPPPPVVTTPPPPVTTPPPPVTENPPPVIEEGGLSPWVIVGSVLGVGGIAALIATSGGNSNNAAIVTAPASP